MLCPHRRSGENAYLRAMTCNRFPLVGWLAGLLLGLGCGDARRTVIEAQVMDRHSEQPIDSAMVLLYQGHPGEQAAPRDTYYTDAAGRLEMTFAPEPDLRYRLQAQRRHYQAVLAASGGRYENEAPIEPGDTNRITLWLKPLPLPDPKRFARASETIPVKEVVAALRSNHWTWTLLPRLTWEDVPALLDVGGDTTYLKPYPRDPRSTYQPDSVRTGLTALWLIEAIRRSRNEERPGGLMPPSRAPVLGTRYGNPSGYNSPQQIQRAHAAYQRWYDQYHDNPAQARRRNPLRGLGMSWM
jgi:hypothetical protein